MVTCISVNVLVAVERPSPLRRTWNVHVFAIFCDGTTCDSDPSAAQCLADPAVAEGLLGGVRILSFSARQVVLWAWNNLDHNQLLFAVPAAMLEEPASNVEGKG